MEVGGQQGKGGMQVRVEEGVILPPIVALFKVKTRVPVELVDLVVR